MNALGVRRNSEWGGDPKLSIATKIYHQSIIVYYFSSEHSQLIEHEEKCKILAQMCYVIKITMIASKSKRSQRRQVY